MNLLTKKQYVIATSKPTNSHILFFFFLVSCLSSHPFHQPAIIYFKLCVWIARLRVHVFSFCVFLFFFFFSKPQLLTKSFMNSIFVYCLWTHKLHFSVTFSLKMGPTALFTHLKIISLQCFQFQFSVFNCIQMDP